jgi:hypothetical protein
MTFFLLCVATPVCRQLAAENHPVVETVVDDRSDPEFWLIQTQPEENAAASPRPARSRLALAAARRRRSTYRLPSMFGDFFAVGTLQATLQVPDGTSQMGNIPYGGGAVGRVKIAENNSPIPRDRFIFNYNFFNDVTGIGDVNRYEFGYEHTFFNESSSVEVAIPFASTLDANQFAEAMVPSGTPFGAGRGATDTRFGDLNITLKTILFEGDDCLIAGGLGMTFPTSGDSRVFDQFGEKIIFLENESVHLLPYLAALHSYESGFYLQGFVQVDVDAGQMSVSGDPNDSIPPGSNLQHLGVLQDQTLLFVDFGVGYWLTDPNLGAPAMAATAELHYATTLQDADIVSSAFDEFELTSAINRFDILNLTLGVSILVNDSYTVRPAMVIPIAGGDDDQFDFEAMVQMNFWR